MRFSPFLLQKRFQELLIGLKEEGTESLKDAILSRVNWHKILINHVPSNVVIDVS